MRKPFDCPHPEQRTKMCKRINAGGGVMVAHQCGDCGRRVGNWIALERVPNWQALPDWDYGIEPAFEKAEKARLTEYREWRLKQEGVASFAKTPDAEVDRKFWEKYGEYLRSPGWAQRRELVLERCAGICEGCRCSKATQVHHLTYDRVGREMLFDLVAVCDDCHESIHGKRT